MAVRRELKATICPYVRTMLSAPDAPGWNPDAEEMEVAALVDFVRAQPGSGSLDEVLKFFAIFNHGVGNKLDRLRHFSAGSGGRFSTHLTGSDGDHAGGSLIYNKSTGEFDREQFTHFTGFSRDGKTMSVDEVARAIVDGNQRHQGSPATAVQSAGEFGLLCALLGDDDGTMKVADMELLFAQNRFPDGARANLGTRTSRQWFDLTARLIDGISAEANRLHLHEGQMDVPQLRKGLKIVFSPLLGGM
jgi:hypothetical protein